MNVINARFAPVFFDLRDRITLPAFEQDDELDRLGQAEMLDQQFPAFTYQLSRFAR